MTDALIIKRIAAEDLPTAAPGLTALLLDAVDDGASVGFTASLTAEQAAGWWTSLAPDLTDERVILWAAHDGDRLIGTVQLRCETSPNGRHRAEIAKLLVHRAARGRGTARRLLTTAEEFARTGGRTLLMLDTQTGSAAENLYRTAGWTALGTVSDYAADPSGTLRPTTFFHKALPTPSA
ncbi:GNAT family N-acetyltransferase [Streptomyces xantholiticus]|uniref:GNAT family N-acetyltransferase n=1 Tax=Streptomyces xantholiticus TaxID=68285 RepID=A0ABV1URZ2_9ACTN